MLRDRREWCVRVAGQGECGRRQSRCCGTARRAGTTTTTALPSARTRRCLTCERRPSSGVARRESALSTACASPNPSLPVSTTSTGLATASRPPARPPPRCTTHHCATRSVMPHQTRHRQDTRHDKTVLSVSCLVCRCEFGDCSERVQTPYFLSATVLSCRESNSHRRSRRDKEKTILSCLSRRFELALTDAALVHDNGDFHARVAKPTRDKCCPTFFLFVLAITLLLTATTYNTALYCVWGTRQEERM